MLRLSRQCSGGGPKPSIVADFPEVADPQRVMRCAPWSR
jgi:hypothetical protein